MGRRRTSGTVLGAVGRWCWDGRSGPAGRGGPTRPGTVGGAAGRPVEQVTLITGDRVLVRAGGQVDVRPAAGRERMTFQRREVRGRTVVLPADAARAVQQGRLDQRLFDVTLLLRAGYSDAERADLPLLLTHEAGAAAAGTARKAGGTDVRPLPGGRVTALSAPKAGGGRLWSTLTSGPVRGAEGVAGRPGAGRRWTAACRRSARRRPGQAGHDGTGVTVAVLDTGIDTDHPDLAGAVTATQDFTENPAGVEDGHGHGTHVASIIAGTGAASDGRYDGVAPDARLLVGKVLDDAGCGIGVAGHRRHGVGRRAGRRRGQHEPRQRHCTDGLDPMSQASTGSPGRPARCSSSRPATAARPTPASAARAPRTRRSPSARSTAPTSSPTSPAAGRGSATARSSRTSPRRAWTSSPPGPPARRSASRSARTTSGCPAPRWPPRTSPARPRSWPGSTRTGRRRSSRRRWSPRRSRRPAWTSRRRAPAGSTSPGPPPRPRGPRRSASAAASRCGRTTTTSRSCAS